MLSVPTWERKVGRGHLQPRGELSWEAATLFPPSPGPRPLGGHLGSHIHPSREGGAEPCPSGSAALCPSRCITGLGPQMGLPGDAPEQSSEGQDADTKN